MGEWGRAVERLHMVPPSLDQADAAAKETAPLVQQESPAEGREALADCVGEAEHPAQGPLSFSLSSSPRHCGDPGGVVTSSLFISFSHPLGSQG